MLPTVERYLKYFPRTYDHFKCFLWIKRSDSSSWNQLICLFKVLSWFKCWFRFGYSQTVISTFIVLNEMARYRGACHPLSRAPTVFKLFILASFSPVVRLCGRLERTPNSGLGSGWLSECSAEGVGQLTWLPFSSIWSADCVPGFFHAVLCPCVHFVSVWNIGRKRERTFWGCWYVGI